MRILLVLVIVLAVLQVGAQSSPMGVLMGNVMDDRSKALASATVELTALQNGEIKKTVVTDKDGAFQISNIPFGMYNLKVSFVGFNTT